MKGCAQLLGLGLGFLHLAALTRAVELKVDQSESKRQICSGMYSRKSWGGNDNPHILIKFNPTPDIPNGEDPLVSVVVFEWKDKPLVGKVVDEAGGVQERVYICNQDGVDAGYCDKDGLGAFILQDNAKNISRSQIRNEAIHLREPPSINYDIKRTGYYCVGTFGYSNTDYSAAVEFRNAFGELPAAQIAKLPFYAAITIVYAFLALAWAALYYLHRRDILPVQNYITAILAFLVFEMFATWLFYDYQNRHGLNAGAKALLGLVSVLSAVRNSFSFFLLLIVCMGYGVVKPSLGRVMIYVRILAVTHFVFGLLYATASLSVTPENAGPLILLVVLPLAGSLTAFYVWTLNSLGATMKDLRERKQTVKASMYHKLWWCILLSIAVIFVFFFVNSWTMAGTRNEDFVPTHWPTRWFILDGWLNLVYFFDVAFIAWVWRPTANNRRFAMSDEIAQDDDGFEIASMRDSFDALEDDLEALQEPTNTSNGIRIGDEDTATPKQQPPAYESGSGPRRDVVSPLPAPVPKKPTSLPRHSLDGETIFAVGEEEDKFEDDDEDEEHGLIGAPGKKGQAPC